MNYINGGRGKKAPYDTEMYRIPKPIKETVQMLAMAFRRAYDSDLISPSHLLNQVQATITSTNLIAGLDDARTTQSSDEAIQLSQIRELVSKWKGNSKDTRNWVEANKLLRELETVLLSRDE